MSDMFPAPFDQDRPSDIGESPDSRSSWSKEPPRAWVLIPAKNAEHTIAEAINSVLEQSFQDFAIIVVDDNSCDLTFEIARHSVPENLGVVLRSEKDLGVSRALNLALSCTQSEYVVRLDADDTMSSHRLESQVNFMDANPQIGASGTWVNTFGEKTSQWKYPRGHIEILLRMGFENAIAHPSAIIRREVLNCLGTPYRSRFEGVEDWDLWQRISLIADLANLPEFLTNYRLHKGQVTRTGSNLRGQMNSITLRFQRQVAQLSGTQRFLYHRSFFFLSCVNLWKRGLITVRPFLIATLYSIFRSPYWHGKLKNFW